MPFCWALLGLVIRSAGERPRQAPLTREFNNDAFAKRLNRGGSRAAGDGGGGDVFHKERAMIALVLIMAVAVLVLGWLALLTLVSIETKQRRIMATQVEIEAGLVALTAQIGKVAAEQAGRFDTLTAAIAALEAQIAAGEATPGVVAALATAQAALTALDEVIPDAPVV